MNRHELYDTAPASDWNHAYPIGNGFLGAMVFGGVRREHLQVNEDSVWSGGPMNRVNPDARRYAARVRGLIEHDGTREAERLAELAMLPAEPDMRHYEPLGDVFIDFGDAARHQHPYERRLDIDAGVGMVRTSVGDVRQTREWFASNPDNVIAYRITAEEPHSIDCVIEVGRMDLNNHGISRCEGVGAVGADTIGLHGVNGGSDGIGYAMAVRAISDDGTVESIGGRIVVRDTSAVTLLVAGRTTYRSGAPMAWCTSTLDASARLGYDALKSRHTADFAAIMSTMSLELTTSDDRKERGRPTTVQRRQSFTDGRPDIGLLETYLTYARYLLASSSRPGSLPANLQGIWNDVYESPWGSKYTVNINAEMNYWFAEKAGLGDLHRPLFDHIRTVAARGRSVAAAMYGVHGFVCHHNTDIWGDCAPQDHYTPASLWPMGGAWLALHLIEHWEYTRDDGFLADNLGIIRDAIRFILDTMTRDPDGLWMTGVSVSPENTYRMADGTTASLCIGPAMDMQITRELFTRYLHVVHETGCDNDDGIDATVRERLANLRPDRVDACGRILEWDRDREETEPGHRHFSPCFGLYPGTTIRRDLTPELAAAAGRLVARRMAHGFGRTGWSRAWALCLHARMADREAAWNDIVRMLADSTLDNLLDNHPPFQIDGNFGALAGFLELLVQDYEDTAYLLPALPDALPNGRADGIRTKAGAELALEWRDGALAAVTLTGLRDGASTFILPDGRTIPTHWHAGERLALDIKGAGS
ncbi:glycoside hydrolase family 95 protein [Bifidobacterium amazonense]|uniref:Glycoside hydrolase family 95 protein n=1 Tax=Bifidobacterium amazonense TaxID=2809027 RepID=A0ABS9VVI8_9BIFI|nr:glycoside hydrolase family 95 protein [Bifidobacterium amazonense]MCH9275974.1 glycoside hydrolase family 95 protein [Bifidobacterium amazonense]